MKRAWLTAANLSRGGLFIFVTLWFALGLAPGALAADQVVTDPGDTGDANQLRAKLTAAQDGGGGTITFNLGAATIVLTGGILADITANITIEGGNVITLSGNNASPLFQVASNATLTLNNITVAAGSNFGDDGGAIRNGSSGDNGSTLNINHCKFLANQTGSTSSGGAIVTYGPLNITNSEFANNQAGNGGAIYPRFSAAVTTISGCNFHDNFTTNTTNGWGGAILLWDGATITISDSDFSTNQAIRGGALFNNFANSSMTVSRTQFRSNSASSVGGAISSESGAVTITDVTFSGNHVPNAGGAISNRGPATLTNVTFSGNSSGTTGGAIENSATGTTATLVNVTLSGNSAGSGTGGIHNFGATISLKNTLIAKGASGANCSGFTGGEFCLSDDNSCGFGAGRDNVMNLLLAPLADNGGPTQTHLPQATSAAIDSATGNGAPVRDQRGYQRAGLAPDVGAVEAGGAIGVTLANISTRLRVETGDNALIGGFIITGGGAKPVLLRGIGPSLSVAGHLDNPTLELHNAAGQTIAANDNWMDAPNRQAIIDTTIPPSSDLESAILMDLDPGSYTAIVRGAGNTTGVGLVEAYDLDRTAGSKLANISTRGLVQTEDNVIIGGFIVLGPDSQKVIVRAIGPSLPVAGALGDPTLELRDGNGALVRSNDNWRSNQQAEILATGIPPANDLESAIVETLPGNGATYTAIVRGAGGSTGIGLVEIYALN